MPSWGQLNNKFVLQSIMTETGNAQNSKNLNHTLSLTKYQLYLCDPCHRSSNFIALYPKPITPSQSKILKQDGGKPRSTQPRQPWQRNRPTSYIQFPSKAMPSPETWVMI